MSKQRMMAAVPQTDHPQANALFASLPAQHQDQVAVGLLDLQAQTGINWGALIDWAIRDLPPLFAGGAINPAAIFTAVRDLFNIWRNPTPAPTPGPAPVPSAPPGPPPGRAP